MSNVVAPIEEDALSSGSANFLKDLKRYYMDFLETDFHKRPLPKRYVRLRDGKGHLAGINLRKYEGFRSTLWDIFTEDSNLDFRIEIKRGQHKSRIKTSLKNFIDQNIEELQQDTLNEIVTAVFKDFNKHKKEYHDDWDTFYEESVEAIKRQVLQKIVQPLSEILEKPLTEEKSLGLETIFELEDDLIDLLCADIEESIDKPIIQFFTKGEIEELTDYLADLLKKELITQKLKKFFENFSSSDLFLEFNEVFENKRLNDKEDIYLYFCDVNFNKRTYPLFYFSLQVEKQTDMFAMRFDPHILVNKKAIEYIVQEYNQEANKTGGINSLKDRIIYLKPDDGDRICDQLQPIISDIALHFSLSDTIDLKEVKPKQQKSILASITNDIYFCLFDRADEALVNDYEELIHLISTGDNPLSEAFMDMINGYIVDEPKSFNQEVEAEWDDRNISERLVYDSPIPLNEEQKKILSAIQKNDCRFLAVQGPPGTGKSHTITAIAFDAIMNNSSVLILSDKQEALDVVEDKIVETINKVRVSDDFQNPILRLDKRNYGKIFTASVITKIKEHYKVSKQKEVEIETLLKAKQSGLQKTISDTIKQYETVELSKIKAFLNVEKAVADKIDIAALNSIDGWNEALVTIRDFFTSAEKLSGREDYQFLLESLSTKHDDWSSDALEDSLEFVNLAAQVKEDGHAKELSIFLNIREDTQESLQNHINRYKALTSGFMKGFFKRSEIKQLEIALNSELEWERSVSFSQDIQLLENLVTCISRIKQKLRQSDRGEDQFLALYNLFSNPNCPNTELLDELSPVSDVIGLDSDVLKPVLNELGVDLSFDGTQKQKSIQASLETLNLLYEYEQSEQNHIRTFEKIPDIDYSGACSQMEELQTTKMTNLIDKRVLDFAENNRNTAQTLKKIIAKKQKFPRDEFEKVKEAFPCIIAGIRDYAEYIPLEKELFDLVIIDEASQVSIAQAFPAILRAKKILVLGDNKQFSNVKTSNASNVVNHRYMNDIRASFLSHIANDTAKLERVQQFNIKTSILEFFDFVSNYSVMLKKHFRGYRELISFSSRWFYDGNLQAIKIRGKSIDDVIKFTLLEHDDKIELPEKANTNPLETEFIIKELEELVEGENLSSVGIITPFTNQQKFIANEISKSDYADEIYEKLKLKVMTFDTCQGEERDIIFYSMVASAVSDRTNYIFASDLKTESDDEKKIRLQRLNVGFSRAKECMHFVVSKPIEDFNGSIGTALKHYQRQLEKGKQQPSEQDVDPSSPMEKKVLEWIKDTSFFQNNQEHIELHAQFPIGDYLKQLDQGYSHPKYRCDFLLQYTKEGKTINIIIEYDGFKEHFTNWDDVNELNYHSYYKASDVEREKILESYGYKFVRINRFNLGADPVVTLSDRLDNLVKKKT